MTGPARKAPETPASEPAADSAPDPVGPVTRAILAGVAMRTGSTLLKRSVDRGILGAAPEALKAAARAAGAKAAKAAKPKKSSLGARLLTAAATRIATRSVPGAIIVGGAMLAKTLHERRKNRPKT
ncbi:hypothetical protein [Novosphingobium sp.]|uniref:hypothetical protein n=1 Tax=Novosphingobium sp. TaxID=1874826 RepID=UPI00260F361A|nr:hypothetical protein [Novosphingobium sp.]